MSDPWITGAIDAADLTAAARVRVFFQHQSVGMNLIGGIPGVFAAKGISAPGIVEVGAAAAGTPPRPSGVFAHGYFGQNGDPIAKIHAFDASIRGGLAEQVDVALMKFCYVDVTSGTDVDTVFGTYSTTMTALEREFPNVTFIHVTTALTTEPGLKATVKRLLGRAVDASRADNVARERLNQLMRQAYGPERLFDLAAVESTAPDGSRVSGRDGGRDYFALYGGYAADDGHLNDAGSRLAAARLYGLIGQTAKG